MKTYDHGYPSSVRPGKCSLALFGLCSLGLIGCPGVTPCGEIAGAQCPADMFCKRNTGACDQTDSLGLCVAKPEICTQVFSPVCGCDGQTYSNACMADSAGVSIDHNGECGRPCCDPDAMPGAGGNPPCIEGVSCCADGTWQCNQGDGSTTCDAIGDVCAKTCGGVAGLPCDAGEYCMMETGQCCCDFTGVCQPVPELCLAIFDPVCGCDGQTYSNSCFAAMAGVTVDHTGACTGNPGGGGGTGKAAGS